MFWNGRRDVDRLQGPNKPSWKVWCLKTLMSTLLIGTILRKLGVALRNPIPYCAWRFDSMVSPAWFNMAWTDGTSSHHVMLLYLNKGEEFALVGQSLPYAHFFSFETYSILGLQSHDILRDMNIVSIDGPNAYANLTAAVNGEKQGGYVIHLTAEKKNLYANEIQALAQGRSSGFFFLVFHLYEVGDSPHPRAPWSMFNRGYPIFPERWGWTAPPKLLVRRSIRQGKGKWRNLPECSMDHRARDYLNTIDWSRYVKQLEDVLPSFKEFTGFIKPNRKNNMHLQRAPRVFHSNDSRALLSAVDVSSAEELVGDGHLWARVSLKLPRTARSLYSPPYIANQSSWDVRYLSFTSASRVFPLLSYSTITEKQIQQHYQNQLPHAMRGRWEGNLVLWVGPENAEIPSQAHREKAMVMRWGERPVGGSIKYPALLYNQVLARVTVSQPQELPPRSAIANSVADQCPDRAMLLAYAELDLDDASQGPERVCCGASPPSYCQLPEYLHLKMREYFPQIEYYIHQPKNHNGPAHIRKMAV